MRIAGTNIIPASYCDDPEVPFAPQIERIGFLVHPETPASFGMFKFAEALIPAPKVKLVALGVHDADEIERAVHGEFVNSRRSGAARAVL